MNNNYDNDNIFEIDISSEKLHLEYLLHQDV